MNIPTVTVNDIIRILTKLYVAIINSGKALKDVPTPFLWGPAGIGKSQAVAQLAKKIGEETNKKVILTDLSLLITTPLDLNGVPVADAERKFTNWLKPKIFDMNNSEEYINILFLDELSAAPPTVQAAAYQICLDRKVGEHSFPKNCIVIAAGNRTTDQSVSFKMPKALCNKLMHFDLSTDYDSWSEWAKNKGLDENIINYLDFDNGKLCIEPDINDRAYPTPRSWNFANTMIKALGNDSEDLQTLIGACVGVDTATEFRKWKEIKNDMPNVNDVINGVCRVYPGNGALHTFISSLLANITARKNVISVQELENACAYIEYFPLDFAMLFYKDLQTIEEIRLKLMKCPSCRSWYTKNKQYL